MRTETDADFAEYVRARQHHLLRSAYLLDGDTRLAEALVARVLTTLAHRWDRLRSEDPDDVVRGLLYRDAVSNRLRSQRERDTSTEMPYAGSLAERRGEAERLEALDERHRLMRAVAGLTARQRAVLVLRCFEGRGEASTAEVLGSSAATVRHQAVVALARLGQAAAGRTPEGSAREPLAAGPSPGLPAPHAAGAPLTLKDVELLLDELSAHVPEVDFAERAWGEAVRRRRRTRRALVGGTAAVGVAALVMTGIALGADEPDRVAPTPVPTTARTGPATDSAPDGTVLVMGPAIGGESGLPVRASGLPQDLRLDAPVIPLESLDRAERSRSGRVIAAYLRPTDSGAMPVIVLADGRHAAVRLSLVRTAGADGGSSWRLDPAAIAPNGSRVAFSQPGAVVVLDVTSAKVRRFAVDDPHLQWAGWTVGQVGIVARSRETSWFVDPDTGSVTRLPDLAVPSHYEIRVDAGRLRLHTWDAYGQRTGQTSLRTPLAAVEGDTVASLSGWAAARVRLDPQELGLRGPYARGILAVQADTPSRRRLLVFRNGPTPRTGCCIPLGWLSGHELLFESADSSGAWILSWNLASGEVSRVSRVTADGGAGSGTVAVRLQ
jgi:RNA polymerase sigma factor (sigma-70 family)